MYTPAPTRSRRFVGCALLAGCAASFALPLPPDSTSLSAEELRLLGFIDGPAPADHQPRRVSELLVLGLDQQVKPFVAHLLPAKVGEVWTRSALEAALAATNERLAGRTDLFDQFTAMLQPIDSLWRLVVDARSRTFGSYGGGNAFAYFGNHNRTGRGDQWGIALGSNRLGGHFDAVVTPGRYLGARLDWSKPSSSAPDQLLQHCRASASLRQILTTTQSLEAETGLWWVRDPHNRLAGPDPLIATTSLAHESDLTWAKPARGMGGTTRTVLLLGLVTNSRQTFAHLRSHTAWRTRSWGRFSNLVTADAELVWRRPVFQPALSGGFGVADAQPDPLDRAVTATWWPRLDLIHRDIGFTALDAGLEGLMEAYWTQGREAHGGLVHGMGIHAGFALPVGVDFLVQWGWKGSRSLGLRLVTEKQF